MDMNLLPQVKSLTNNRQKEALRSYYLYGHIFTFVSVKIIGLKCPIELINDKLRVFNFLRLSLVNQ